MIVKTSELTHNALCYALCMIEMPHLVWGETIGLHRASNQIVVPELPAPQCYSPFMGWDMFGPIFDRERISIECHFDRNEVTAWTLTPEEDGEAHGSGLTPLMAARICYVASQLGNEVDIPDELLSHDAPEANVEQRVSSRKPRG